MYLIRLVRRNRPTFFITIFFVYFMLNVIAKKTYDTYWNEAEANNIFNIDASSIRAFDNLTKTQNYLIPYSIDRLNGLFKLLQDAEAKHEQVFRQLGLVVFSDLVDKPDQQRQFEKEIRKFINVKNGRIEANPLFFKQLQLLSNYYSFLKPRDFVVPKTISADKKLVIVTAANSVYYGSLQATLFYIHKHLPGYKIIVYDLGLDANTIEKTKANCKCELRKFNADKKYSKISSHFDDLKTYAWKPIIIQEALKDNELVMYMDSSIRLKTGQIDPILNTVKTTGILTQFIGLELKCYTDPKMFTWFHETPELYNKLWTIEANFLIMHRNFINSLLMKAWITCALDKNCIAPEGARISGCCGCHRFDQAALSLLCTYFYGHPTEMQKYLPAYSFTKNESYFFSIERYTTLNYFN